MNSPMNSPLYDAGLKVRKEVLGTEHVERSLNNAGAFGAELQQLATEYCWGAVWTRPGLDKKTRSMLNLAMLSALNRPHELRMHLAGAIRNGVERDQIKEVLLQVGIYCGIPAAVDSFRIAQEVFAELDKKPE